MIDKKYNAKKDYSGGIWNDFYDNKTYSVIKQYSDKIDDSIYEEVVKAFDYHTSTKSVPTVSQSEHKRVVEAKYKAESKAEDATNAIHAMTDGKIDVQRQLIQIDPHNIQYIRNPYVDIQLEAIMADSTCFPKINNPAQEAIDMYRLVK